jgi:hypothetical protein
MAPSNPSTTLRTTDTMSQDVALVRQDYFGSPSLLPGEDPAVYDALLTRIARFVSPKDVLEEIWVREAGDHIWEEIRLRRHKANLLQSSLHEGLRKILEPLMSELTSSMVFPEMGPEEDGDPVGDLAKRWARRQPKALKQVERVLASAALTMEAVTAQTFALKLDEVERIDRLLSSSEARRNNSLREIDRHRETLSTKLRLAAQEAEEFEFVEVPAGYAME